MIQYDAIRLVAILAIVLLHTAANGVSALPAGSSDWWLANIADSASRVGVPLFLMLSGATLLTRQHGNARLFYRRRLQRLALPVLAWSLIYLAWAQLKAYWKQQPLPDQFHDLLIGLLSGHNYFHLWFIYLLIGLYAALPLCRQLWQRLTPQQQLFSTLVALALQQGLLLLRFASGSSVPNWLVNADTLPWPLWFIAYLPYLMLGALLHPADTRAAAAVANSAVANNALANSAQTASAQTALQTPLEAPLKAQLFSHIAFLLLTLCLLVTTTAGLYAWQQQSIGPEPFYYAYHRLSLPVMLSALCVWLLVRRAVASQLLSQHSPANQQSRASEKPSLASPITRKIVQCSFGIYLVHPIFLDLSQALLQYTPLQHWPYPILLPLQSLFIASASLTSCLLWQYLWQHLRQTPPN